MRSAFTGAFAPYICGLIEKKQALGYDYHGSACILRTFDEFCREQFPNETCLTAELAMKWAEQFKTEKNLSRLNRVSVIRELAKHMNSVGEQAYLLPLQLTKKTGRHIPYIYSKEDLSKLFKEIDSLQPSLRAPTKHLVVSVIFRMIYCCGLICRTWVTLVIYNICCYIIGFRIYHVMRITLQRNNIISCL